MRGGAASGFGRQENGAARADPGADSTHDPGNAPAGRPAVVREGPPAVPEAGSSQAPMGRQPAMGEAALPPFPSARPTHGQTALPGTPARGEPRDTPPVAGGVPAPNQVEEDAYTRVTSSVLLDSVGLADEPHLRCPWWWRLPLAQRARVLRKHPDRASPLAVEDTAVQRGAAITQRPPQAAGAAVREPDLLGHRPRSSAPRRPQYLAGIPPPMERTLYGGKPLVNPQTSRAGRFPGSYAQFALKRAERDLRR